MQLIIRGTTIIDLLNAARVTKRHVQRQAALNALYHVWIFENVLSVFAVGFAPFWAGMSRPSSPMSESGASRRKPAPQYRDSRGSAPMTEKGRRDIIQSTPWAWIHEAPWWDQHSRPDNTAPLTQVAEHRTPALYQYDDTPLQCLECWSQYTTAGAETAVSPTTRSLLNGCM